MNGDERGDAPKTFCAAEDRPFAVSRSAVRVMLEDGSAILHDEHGDAALALGIFCRARAIAGAQFRQGSWRCCDEKKARKEHEGFQDSVSRRYSLPRAT